MFSPTFFNRIGIISLLLTGSAAMAVAQLSFPAASPEATVQQQIGLTNFEIA